MIHVLNDLPMKCDVNLDGLGNRLTLSSDDALTTEVIRKKTEPQVK